MPLHTLLDSGSVAAIALVATTTDRVAVWGALALVVALIAWREYTLPEPGSSPVSAAARREPEVKGRAGTPVEVLPSPPRPRSGSRTGN